MKRLVLLVVVLALAGCAANAKTYEKKGRRGLHIDCSGISSSWEQCEQRAKDSCGRKGYRVMAKSGGEKPDDDSGDFLFGINPAGFSSRSMIVMCR